MFAGQALPSLAAHHRDIEAIQLTTGVPEAVAIQFETARNFYLYAWHVYRFFPVAQSQALFALEFGLRVRFLDRLPERYQRPRQQQPMLAGLLGYAIDEGLIRNEGFGRWHRAAEDRARQRRSMEIIRMRSTNDAPQSKVAERVRCGSDAGQRRSAGIFQGSNAS